MNFNAKELKKLYIPAKMSHKGQNGKLTVIGGSGLFHGASLWALKVASRIVDMVFYSSTVENNELTQKLKGEFYDFIAVPRGKVEEYISQSDAVLIGPGLAREEGREKEEESTKQLTERLLKKFPTKKWVIDAGSLQEMEAEWLKELNGNVVITPHHKEFKDLFHDDNVEEIAKKYNCVVLLKGPTDVVCSLLECVEVIGGNEGMTKGGTGDVLAGLVAALSCKNDLFLAAAAGSFINKKAGDSLYKKVGPYFNASDLADEIPKTMKEMLPFGY
ncbi:NAD(P)H-hydrate dehydratase [Candidatus Microgenomates bacterium]|nr:NAD(P)H-hydrate dehydratase [Candidatus Microgenomates bacterium]